MNNCKYCVYEITNVILHKICSNDEHKYFNKSSGKGIPCMGISCGRFEENGIERKKVGK